MALQKVKIVHDGSHYIASLPNLGDEILARMDKKRGIKIVDPCYEQFKVFYGEAIEKKITKKKVLEYIQGCFIDVCEDILELPDNETLEDYYKRYVTALHKRMQRYHRKAYLNEWNYFVTFTYDDKKMSANEFKRQITTKLSDLSSHHGWRYMMRWEEGELGERTHLHAVVYVPKGKMVGELFTDSHYSYKRRKREIFTNNTYFNSRFGTSDWKSLDNLRNCKSLVNYLTKYMAKDDGKIIYSRGIPDSLEAEVDLDESGLVEFLSHCRFKVVIDPFIFGRHQERTGALRTAFDIDSLLPDCSALAPA